jgi:DNA primase
MDVVRLHQAGITYAVATLGTATTPEHLSRVFRICNELVFCFDGDRAGRAAAWRALENSLSQIREGRQIRFLFLPDGHDPDSLVGAEGREAFEARLKQAVPLSGYFIGHLSAQVDMETVDGRARMGELARPLLARIPEGIYRELLADELAAAVRIDRSRLDGALGVTRPDPARNTSAADSGQDIDAGRTGGTQGAAREIGNRNIVRQAIRLLVHYPQIADKAGDPSVISGIERPGIPLLVELLAELQKNPVQNTGALLERWRGRPNVEHLAKLAAQECIPDAAGAAKDLVAAIARLLEEDGLRRSRQLLSKRESQGLTDAEKAELQGLLRTKSHGGGSAERRT